MGIFVNKHYIHVSTKMCLPTCVVFYETLMTKGGLRQVLVGGFTNRL